MKNWYGCIGFVSLLGVWGLIGSEPLFLSFFAFALFFEYFWVTPDEMFVDTIKRCASWAFFANLFITTAATFALSYFKMSSNPLAAGNIIRIWYFNSDICFFYLCFRNQREGECKK